jgi:hypothetical protein
MRRSMRGALGVTACLAVLLAACSSADEPVATAPPATLVPTTAPSSTVAPTTVATTTPPSTLPPTTALDDPARMRAAEAAYIAAWEAYHAAILDPANPELREAIRRTYTGANLEGVLETLDGFVASGIVARANAIVPSEVSIQSAAKPIPGEDDGADLIACERNSESYFEVRAAPNGEEALLRDEIVVLQVLVRIKYVAGRWRSESGETLSRLSGDVECPR